MRRALWACLLSFMVGAAGCATLGGSRSECGAFAPVVIYATSDHFYDVVIRDENGRRLDVVEGLKQKQQLSFCTTSEFGAQLYADPVGGGMGYGLIMGGVGTIAPGSVIYLSLGSNLRISFADVWPASAP
jgi:hypothetical protein